MAAFKARLGQALGSDVASLTLFGSRARGEGTEDSDIDILVLLRRELPAGRRTVFGLAADIFLEFEINISPLTMTRAHFEDMKQRERLLALTIDKEGIPL